MANGAYALRFNGELASQLMARAPRLLAGALVVLLGVRAALLLSQLAGPPVPAASAALPPPAPAPTRNVVDVPAILRANLFGKSPPAAGTADAPVTSMPLTLGGVGAYDNPKRGYAMIGTSNTDIKFYLVGAALPGGALLHEVYQDKVLLDRGGTIEALLLPPRAGTPPPPPPPPVAFNGAVPVQRVQQVIRENPGILNQVLSRTPQFVNGKLSGMKVYPGANAQAFNRLGLKAGDLVTAINGTPLEDRTRSEEIFNTLSTAAEAHITVMRNSTQQELHLNLAEIANEAERLAQQATAPAPAPTAAGEPPGPESAR